MNKLLTATNRYIRSWTVQEVALFKTCAVAFGVVVGLMIPARRKSTWAWIAGGIFATTYFSLLLKFLPFFEEEEFWDDECGCGCDCDCGDHWDDEDVQCGCGCGCGDLFDPSEFDSDELDLDDVSIEEEVAEEESNNG